MLFVDRRDAGQQLAARLDAHLRAGAMPAQGDLWVLGVPRGGVIVAAEVARRLHAALDIYLTHKIGAPGNQEFAIGAVTMDGALYLNPALLDISSLSAQYIDQARKEQLREMRRREALYRQGRPPLQLHGQRVILVDDGIATGATLIAALRGLRHAEPAWLLLAAPVAPPEVLPMLRRECDDLLVLAAPPDFDSVGRYYVHFEQESDARVVAALQASMSDDVTGVDEGE
jgi:predicted phosphoribosyltransferase